ncbi:MAG: cytochrome b/b6 domain-containing protein [Candidatus Rokubacteria bacterium]|nr:cytochrome b/b6 domain-containing protein [Candidatus Rokubacteria bacterium]
MSEVRLVRFSPVERAFHLLYLVAFLALSFTGAALYFAPFRPYAAGDAGTLGRLIHRIAAIVLVAGPVLYVLFDRRSLGTSLRWILRWGRDDWAWFRAAQRVYWRGERRVMPPQGKYNTGQKLSVWIQMACFVAFVVTGAVMWFWAASVSAGVFRLAVIVHDAAFVVAFGFFLLHLYLVLFHPFTRHHVNSMVDGTIAEPDARELYPRWHDEVTGAAGRGR